MFACQKIYWNLCWSLRFPFSQLFLREAFLCDGSANNQIKLVTLRYEWIWKKVEYWMTIVQKTSEIREKRNLYWKVKLVGFFVVVFVIRCSHCWTLKKSSQVLKGEPIKYAVEVRYINFDFNCNGRMWKLLSGFVKWTDELSKLKHLHSLLTMN